MKGAFTHGMEIFMGIGLLECVAYAFVPSLCGWFLNTVLVMNARVGSILSWIFPIVMLFFWYWVGGRYAKLIKNPALAIALGNSVGILSIGVYLWQEFLAPEKNLVLQSLSQMFANAISMISIRIVAMASPKVDGVTQVSNTALQFVGFVLLALPFAAGYFGKRQKLSALNKKA